MEYFPFLHPVGVLKKSQFSLISAVCEASQSASSDYKSQIDFFPWRFYHKDWDADLVAEAGRFSCRFRSYLSKQLGDTRVSFELFKPTYFTLNPLLMHLIKCGQWICAVGV